ncbi:ABC transporter permease [Mesorhizobium sp. LHD-90]|uniref:ABC transporter permease n=1 Tax=Mesorhizobium sp. LHD-90 TaxID=3071414 RepID=UPI0027E009ED|nr:ABC transporter permease [Mesorhizobium sp. LHD-90]MDQ6432540.1 ABC transporter permease [Mesorhizobium sp. LHD-90]
MIPSWVGSLIILAVFLGVWEGYVHLFDVSKLVLPPPSEVVLKWLEFLVSKSVWYHTGVTAWETFLGFVFAGILGVSLGFLLGKMPRLERMLNPFVIATQVIPKVALVPLFVVWFGFGMTSKVVIATILAFFPILLNTVLGIKSVDHGHEEVMKSLNATRWQRLTQLDFPSSLPYILTGMEVGVVLSIIGAVVGEYLGGNTGLGNLAVKEMNSYNTTALFAVIMHLSILGFAFYAVVVGMRKYLIPWHGSSN